MSTSEINARNLVVFMSDSIRWDNFSKKLLPRGGTAFKTIASSSWTPTSIASMLTGKYLPGHGVFRFADSFRKGTKTLLDYFDNYGLSSVKGDFDDPAQGDFFNETIYNNLLEPYETVPLKELEEPFGWFMRDPGGHAPYGCWDEEMNVDISVPDFYEKYAGEEEKMRSLYREGVDRSIERFQRYVIDPLEQRGILDDTLIVFVSDHGEWLGEHGHYGQSFPISPEIVYVPTVLMHPDIPVKESVDSMRHIDLLPTVCGALDIPLDAEIDGTDILAGPTPKRGACLYKRYFPSFCGEFKYEVSSLWDSEGGHVFNRSSRWSKLKLTAGYAAKMAAGKNLLRSPNLSGYRLLLEKERQWGAPEFTSEEAAEGLGRIEKGATGSSQANLESEELKQNLKDLGYL